jgi:hypothetical protein
MRVCGFVKALKEEYWHQDAPMEEETERPVIKRSMKRSNKDDDDDDEEEEESNTTMANDEGSMTDTADEEVTDSAAAMADEVMNIISSVFRVQAHRN